jgi:CheY-like chemotaxis protein
VHQVALRAAESRRAAKIVLAEDDVLVRLELAEALRHDRFQVFEAADVSEAISILKSTPDIDVVVSDMSMRTVQDGIELARYVRRHHPGTSLVLASAHSQSFGTSAVFDAFFAKPYCAREMATWIRRHLGGMEMLQAGLP